MINAEVSSSVSSANINLQKVGGSATDKNSGNASNGSQRVVIATDDVNQAAINTAVSAMNAKMVSGTDIGDVTINNSTGASAVNIQDGGNSITVDGTVTANLSATDNGVLDNIDADCTTLIGHVDGVEGLLTTIDTDMGTVVGAISGTEVQVDVVTLPDVTIAAVVDTPEFFEDLSFVTGDSPVTLDLNTALGRNATQFTLINDGDGSFTVELSTDGAAFGDSITMYVGERMEYENISVDSIRITWVSNSSYRCIAL
jgi:hypothetical protein